MPLSVFNQTMQMGQARECHQAITRNENMAGFNTPRTKRNNPKYWERGPGRT